MKKEKKSEFSSIYSYEVQVLYLQWFLSEPDIFSLCRNILKDSYFEPSLRQSVRFILEYADEHYTVPLPEQVRAKTGLRLDKLSEEVKSNHSKWVLKDIEGFCRQQALESAVLDGVDLIQNNRGGELEQRIKDAMMISLISDLGTNYFADPFTRLEQLRDKAGYVSTGWKSIDDVLFGGFTRQALNVFTAGSGIGKSLLLQNLAINWAQMGLNVVYFSLELSENLISLRLDAMNTGKTTKEVMKDIIESAEFIKMKGKNSGQLIIKKFPESGTTVNDFKAFLKELEIKTGIKVDGIIVDYLDLMTPVSVKVNPSDLFVKDKYSSEELRAMSFETNTLMASASQLNRGGTQTQEFDHSHIGGGISKIYTSDNVMAIYAPGHMKEKGIMEIQFLKTRSSSGEGKKVSLSYNPETMRIEDMLDFEPKTKEAIKNEIDNFKNTKQKEPDTTNQVDATSAIKQLISRRK